MSRMRISRMSNSSRSNHSILAVRFHAGIIDHVRGQRFPLRPGTEDFPVPTNQPGLNDQSGTTTQPGAFLPPATQPVLGLVWILHLALPLLGLWLLLANPAHT